MAGLMKYAAPRMLPPLHVMLSDLGHPDAPTLARVLGVHRRTVERWQAADRAPRAVLVALFWSTRWGRSQVAADAVNDAGLLAALARSATEAAATAQKQNAHLLRVGEFGSANEPVGRWIW